MRNKVWNCLKFITSSTISTWLFGPMCQRCFDGVNYWLEKWVIGMNSVRKSCVQNERNGESKSDREWRFGREYLTEGCGNTKDTLGTKTEEGLRDFLAIWKKRPTGTVPSNVATPHGVGVLSHAHAKTLIQNRGAALCRVKKRKKK